MHFLVVVEEEGHPHHRQEGSAETGNADVRIGHDAFVFGGIVEGQGNRLERSDLCRDGDDRNGKDDAHAEDRDQDPDGQEALLPDRIHIAQHGGVDHRIIEAERNFEDREDKDDPQNAEGGGDRPGARPAIPSSQRKADRGKGEGERVVFAHGFHERCSVGQPLG